MSGNILSADESILSGTKGRQGASALVRELTLLVLLLVMAACQPIPPGPPLDVAIVHTNDTWGYIRPCG